MKEIVALQASVDGVLRFNNCTSPEQECILFQPDVGVDGDRDQPTTSQRATAREEFARPTKKRQQQRMTAWTTEQSKQFDLGRWREAITFCRDECLVSYIVCSFFSCFVCSSVVYIFCLVRKAGTRGEDNFHSRMREGLGCTRCVNCCTRTGACIFVSTCVNQGYSLYHVAPFPPHIVLFFLYCIAFEMIGRFWYQLMVTTDR